MTEVSSFCEFWEAVKDINPDRDETLFFRGHPDKKFEFVPTAFREKEKDAEQRFYREIMVEYPEKFMRREHLSNLVAMQHYGIPTRLLDFSRNPLIALYFACETHPDTDGQVLCFKKKKLEILHHNSDKALMLACLPQFSDEQKGEIKRFCQEHSDVITDKTIGDNRTMQRFLHEIRSELPAFETEIVGKDLLKSYFVATFKDNDRMKAQNGAFIICGLDKDNLQKIGEEAIRINIDHNSKKEILKDLKLMGFNSSTVYPDFERRAFMLREKKVQWVDVD
jgi:hypothetical protein